MIAEQIEARITNLRGLLQSPEGGREALQQLFGDNRIRVSPHPERGLAIEGVAVLELMHPVGGAGDSVRPSHCSRWPREVL